MVVLLFSGLYLFAGWHLAHNVVAKHYVVENDKVTESLRVALISDSHVGVTFDGDGFAREIEKISDENVDILVIVGDYVDDDTSYEDMVKACKGFSNVKTNLGIYYVFGNHDKGYYANEKRGYGEKELIEELTKNNVTVLQDEIVKLKDSFLLIGRKDRSSLDRLSMQTLMEKTDRSMYSIVLDHQPNDYKAQENAKVDLVLSGHTHGGQLIPINYLGEWTGLNDLTYGMRKKGDTTFVVSSGISSWALRFKTGCIAEYVIIDIVPR